MREYVADVAFVAKAEFSDLWHVLPQKMDPRQLDLYIQSLGGGNGETHSASRAQAVFQDL